MSEVRTMSKTVGDMTKDELRQMLDTVVEEKLMDLLGDPDEGLELREELQQRLLKQMEKTAAGERGISLEEAKRKAGIE